MKKELTPEQEAQVKLIQAQILNLRLVAGILKQMPIQKVVDLNSNVAKMLANIQASLQVKLDKFPIDQPAIEWMDKASEMVTMFIKRLANAQNPATIALVIGFMQQLSEGQVGYTGTPEQMEKLGLMVEQYIVGEPPVDVQTESSLS